MGENLEFFIENRVIEALAAFALTDQPQGFFKFLLGAIEDLIQSVDKQTSILSHISVNASVRQVLRTIQDKLHEIPFTHADTENARQPDEQFIRQQRPSVMFYTIDILKFINTLIFKVQNEVHLIRLLFCQKDKGLLNLDGGEGGERLREIRQYQLHAQGDPSTGCGVISSGGASPVTTSPARNPLLSPDKAASGVVTYDVCLPFHILVYYTKNAKCMLTPCEKDFLDDVVVMAFNSLSIDAKFACYLINESDFIEIVMSEISSSFEALPSKLAPKDDLGNFNIIE